MCSEAGGAIRPLVVIPAYNEAASVREVVQSIRSQCGLPVLVVDDHSEDHTAREARRGGADVLRLPLRLGAWLATQAGLRLALRRGYTEVVTCDADGQHLAADVARLAAHLGQGGHDMCIGSCVERGSTLRHVAWYLFRRLSRLQVQDLTSGLRAYNARTVRLLASPLATLFDYQDLSVLILLRAKGFSIGEIEVSMCPRRNGKSRIFFSWYEVAKYMIFSLLIILAKPASHLEFDDDARL